jgi:hypothetical protein
MRGEIAMVVYGAAAAIMLVVALKMSCPSLMAVRLHPSDELIV